MKPLIKWAGGKSGEVRYITKIIPRFDGYMEPFFGGGALFFHLEPRKAVINDISAELMMLYSFLKDGPRRAALRRELDSYVRYWERISTYMRRFGDSFLALYERYRHDMIADAQFQSKSRHSSRTGSSRSTGSSQRPSAWIRRPFWRASSGTSSPSSGVSNTG